MEQKTQCLIIAGEKSGEEHAQSFLPQLIDSRPDIHFFGVGGEYFKSIGIELTLNFDKFHVMGFTEAIQKLPFFLSVKKQILTQVRERKCEHAILIDFQEFNYNLAKSLHQLGIKVFYYVAPQAWAWRSYRGRKISARVEDLFCILPFEEAWFKERGVKNCHYIGHPMVEKVVKYQEKHPELYTDEKSILFLPGSRETEVRFLLPEFIKLKKLLAEKYHFKSAVVISENLSQKTQNYIKDNFDDFYYSSELFEVLKKTSFCIASSGTVNLALSLFNIPTVVCYKVSLMNEFLFHQIARYKGDASLVNIIAGHQVFPELLQDECTAERIEFILSDWFGNQEKLQKLKDSLGKVNKLLLAHKEQFDLVDYLSKKL